GPPRTWSISQQVVDSLTRVTRLCAQNAQFRGDLRAKTGRFDQPDLPSPYARRPGRPPADHDARPPPDRADRAGPAARCRPGDRPIPAGEADRARGDP